MDKIKLINCPQCNKELRPTYFNDPSRYTTYVSGNNYLCVKCPIKIYFIENEFKFITFSNELGNWQIHNDCIIALDGKIKSNQTIGFENHLDAFNFLKKYIDNIMFE